MNARKCDRCGIFYDRYEETAKLLDYRNYHPGISAYMIDLCPICEAGLIEWIDSYKEDKKNEAEQCNL